MTDEPRADPYVDEVRRLVLCAVAGDNADAVTASIVALPRAALSDDVTTRAKVRNAIGASLLVHPGRYLEQATDEVMRVVAAQLAEARAEVERLRGHADAMAENGQITPEDRDAFDQVRDIWHYARRGTPDGAVFERSEQGSMLMRSIQRLRRQTLRGAGTLGEP